MEKLTEQSLKKKIRNFITLNSVSKDEIRQEYNEIYDKLKEYEDKQEWISVNERLPEIPKDSDCITVLGYNGEIHDYIIDSENRWWDDDGWSTPSGFGITHWMPLPQPPQMKGD